MKTFLVVVCSLACAYAAAVSDPAAVVVRSLSQASPDGNFQYAYETDNGISANVDGKLKSLGKDEYALEVVGNSEYVAPNGEKFQLTYIANEDGYQPQGAHLPTTPAPIPYPDYIARALEYIASHPPKDEYAKRV